MSLDLVVLGNLLVDDVVLPDGRTRMAEPGGAVLYFALAARLWGLRVGIVSVRGDDYPEHALETLAERGVALEGIRALGRPGLRSWLLYEGARRHLVHRLDGPTHAQVSPLAEHIPAEWLKARCFHLAPMPFPIQQAGVGGLRDRGAALISVDPYEMVGPDTLPAWRGLLAAVDVFFLSQDEMELPPDEASLLGLAGGRLRSVVFKRGARGGTLYDFETGARHSWAARAAAVVDPTGAGDAFAAGVLAGWLRGEAHPRALRRGIVGASFALADFGPAGIMAATAEAAELRLRDWFEASGP